MRNHIFQAALALILYPLVTVAVAATSLVLGLYYNIPALFAVSCITPIIGTYVTVAVLYKAGKAATNG